MDVFDFQARRLDGTAADLKQYRGKVLLIVNTASRCGFTPQYEGLEALYREYRARGLEVLGFPCNQFGRQEPGSAEDIDDFCSSRYAVSFPLFEKIEVNGPNAHLLYRHLKAAAPGLLGTRAIKWNFTKFLIGRDGSVVGRYAPRTPPAALARDIEKLLAE
jgi:glutathione peroxidase